mmetsp:Transcript_28062/g.61569  ORF Transcript_28062/g.61569 Transcript_28062/m.61569 type:complete len:593 (-) Transcript_28062:1053-2831(-)
MVHKSLQYDDFGEVEKKFESLKNAAASLSSTGCAIGAVLRSASVEYGGGWCCVAIHMWADYRYDISSECYAAGEKAWLREMTDDQKNEDAVKSLNLLLDHGADPYAKASCGQTPLHLAMSFGYSNVVLALLTNDRVQYTVERLNEVDQEGDNPISSALGNAQWECVELFLDKCPLENVFYVFDKKGNNILALLCQYCCVNYHDADFDAETLTKDHAQSLYLLRDLLRYVEEREMVDVLLHKNIYGENCLHVAARCCNHLEVEALLAIEFWCGRAVANCFSEELGMAPLDCAECTLDKVQREAEVDEFEQWNIYGLDGRIEEDRTLSNWKNNSITRVVNALKAAGSQKSTTMARIANSRPGLQLGGGQRPSSSALRVLDSFKTAHARVTRGSIPIKCKHRDWMTRIRRDSTVGRSICKQIEEVHDISFSFETHRRLASCVRGRNERGVVNTVEPFLIRDPSDPCLKRSTYALCCQFGIRAIAEIPENTVIGEYSGDLYREGETESDFGASPAYGYALNTLDEWVEMHQPDGSNEVFILDSKKYGNETSLINDATPDFMDGDRDSTPHNARNVDFVEVIVDNVPRVIVVATKTI